MTVSDLVTTLLTMPHDAIVLIEVERFTDDGTYRCLTDDVTLKQRLVEDDDSTFWLADEATTHNSKVAVIIAER